MLLRVTVAQASVADSPRMAQRLAGQGREDAGAVCGVCHGKQGKARQGWLLLRCS